MTIPNDTPYPHQPIWLLCIALVVMPVYILATVLLRDYGTIAGRLFFSACLMLALAGMGWSLARRWGWGPMELGFHLRNWKQHAHKTAAVTALVMALLVLGKWLLIQFVPSMTNAPLFGLDARLELYGVAGLCMLFVGYVLLVPIQEFLVRGLLQTYIEQQLGGVRHRTLIAIGVSNVAFASMHLHNSYTIAALSLAGGLLWGWMYARHRALPAICVSHIAIGFFAVYVLASKPI